RGRLAGTYASTPNGPGETIGSVTGEPVAGCTVSESVDESRCGEITKVELHLNQGIDGDRGVRISGEAGGVADGDLYRLLGESRGYRKEEDRDQAQGASIALVALVLNLGR